MIFKKYFIQREYQENITADLKKQKYIILINAYYLNVF